MAAMFFFVWIIIILTFFAVILSSTKIKGSSSRKRTVAHDGHVIPREKDITCETVYGHNHGLTPEGRRYIVHEDPPEGYVILNGIKRSLDECKNL